MASIGNEKKFACPSDFISCPSTAPSSFTTEELNSASTELWLIKAPLDFNPASFNSQKIPLIGFQSVKIKTDGKKRFYNIFSSPRETGTSHLVVHSAEDNELRCGPPFRGYINICDSSGDSAGALHPIPASPVLQIPEGLKQRFQPFGAMPPTRSGARNDRPGEGGTQGGQGEPCEEVDGVKRRRKKKKRKKHGEEVEQLACVEQEALDEEGSWGNPPEMGQEADEGLQGTETTTKKRKKKKREKERADISATALEMEDSLEDLPALFKGEAAPEAAGSFSDETGWTEHRKKKRKRPS